MSKHSWVRRVATAVVVVVAFVGAVIGGRLLVDRLSDDEVADESASDVSTAVAEVRTLSIDYEAAGSLTYEPSIAVTTPVAGTIVDVVDVGTMLTSGDVIAVVDDAPVVWLDGAVPAWRTMTEGDVGVDVAQLETVLDAMGFNGDAEVTVDDEFTAATAAMVESWQEATGAPANGRVDLGTVVFGGARSRVAGVAVATGESVGAGDELVSLGSEVRIASFAVTPTDAVTLEPGDTVSVGLPDRSTVEATVDQVARGADTWTVTTSFGPVDLPALDTIDVTLEWERLAAAEGLTIPSSSLLRLDDGSYVVDVMSGGFHDRRTVEIGIAVGTRVEIINGLSEGDVVVTL